MIAKAKARITVGTRVALTLAALAALMALAPVPAFAAHTYQGRITKANGSAFTSPNGLAVDAAGDLWVADSGGAKLLDKFSPFAAGNAYLTQSNAGGHLATPNFIAYSTVSDRLYASNPSANSIVALSPAGAFETEFTGLNGASALAADNSAGPTAGDLYVLTGGTITRLGASGAPAPFAATASYLSGNKITGDGIPGTAFAFHGTGVLAVAPSGDLYVAFQDGEHVDQFKPSGEFVRQFAIPRLPATPNPQGLAVDPTDGDLLLADQRNEAVDEFTSTGRLLGHFTGKETPSGEFLPTALAVDPGGVLYVANPPHHEVDVYSPSLTPSFALTVNQAGAGSGEVVCEVEAAGHFEACEPEYPEGTQIVLAAGEAAGSSFEGFSGDCSGSGLCSLTMSAAKSLTATFEPSSLPTFKLEVIKEGKGSGEVTSLFPAKSIACGTGAGCEHEYNENTLVTLAAVPTGSHSEFTGWSGCDAVNGAGRCEVTIAAARTVHANFRLIPVNVEVAFPGSGEGSVTGSTATEPGVIECSNSGGTVHGACSHVFGDTESVEFTATAAVGSRFLGWASGELCAPPRTGNVPCHFSVVSGFGTLISKPSFEAIELSVAKSGAGTVTSDVAGIHSQAIACGAHCKETYAENTLVTLTATPGPNSTFEEWNGACSGSGSCQVTMSEAKQVEAVFITTAPVIDSTSADSIGATEATLHAEVNPSGAATTARFQYVTEAQFEADQPNGFLHAEETPESAPIGADRTDHEVSATLTGLAPATAYYYRAVASNEHSPAGGTPGPTEQLYTNPTAFAEACPENETIRARQAESGLVPLPDCRAYEQASPPGLQKNGVDAAGAAGLVYASPAGTAISYFSLIPFSPAAGSGASKYPIYRSSRAGAPPLWSTRGLMPLSALSEITDSQMVGLSEDAARSIVAVGALQPPLTPCEPALRVCATPDHGSLYVEDNATGAYQFIAVGSAAIRFAAASADDSRLLFQTAAQLLPAAAPGVVNLYLWDEAKPSSERLSLVGLVPSSGASCAAACLAPTAGSGAGAGEPVNSSTHIAYLQHTISADGSRAFFTDEGTGFLYERLLDAGETIRVSAGTGPADFREATPDGRYVFYTEGENLYRFDTETEQALALTSGSAGALGDLGVSDDGASAYFAATAALTGGEENEWGASAQAGQPNLYRWHQGTTTFIASGGEEADWRNFANPSLEAQGPSGGQRSSRLNPDGSVLLFAAENRLTSYDNAGATEFYRYDSRRPPGQRLRCVSCNPSAAAATVSAAGQARLTSENPALVTAPSGLTFLTRNLSADGSRAFFQTAESLLPADVNAATDVYEWEEPGAGSCRGFSPAYSPQDGGCLYLISTGTDPKQSYFGDASADGSDVFFFTRQRLVSQDSDDNSDLYDARSGGGLEAQSPPQHSPPCAGEASCLPAAAIPPAQPGALTESFHGPGNGSEPAKCKKGAARRHGSCVKRKKHHRAKKHHSKRSAHANRRADR